MSEYTPPDFEMSEIEIANALSTLQRHGININLPENLAKRFSAITLFDGDDFLFKELIKKSQIYFEYGCGKSTEYVYKYTSASIFSVDTSKDWVEKIKSVAKMENSERLNLNWVDVGELADWGCPTSFKKRQNFKKYAELFWLSSNIPDLVLIDGRFRVFCFLTSVKFAPIGTKILFDDYTNRPFYHLVEEFSDRLDVCGRQALFEVNKAAKERITDEVISSFQNVID